MGRQVNVLTWMLMASCAMGLHAQCEMEEPRPSKAQKLYQRATQPKGKSSLADRIEWIEQALDLHPEDPEALMAAAELAFKSSRKNPEAWASLEEWLTQLDEVCPEGLPEALYLRGAQAYMNDEYERALTQFRAYLSLPEDQTRRSRRREVNALQDDLAFLHQYHRHEGRSVPQPLPELSWDDDEYLPMLSPDGTRLFFTRTSMFKAKGDITSTRKEALTMASRPHPEAPFDGGVPLGDPFNMGDNYGGASLSVDNKTMVIAARRPVPGNPGNIDLFSSAYELDYHTLKGEAVYYWSPLEPLGGSVNTPQGWEAQPSISGDGKELFFAGAREGSTSDANGNLTMDLFVSRLNDAGEWGAPLPLPAPINSEAHDKAPFMHPDGVTLYFSSDRTPGGGGFDLWMTQRDTSGLWSEPVNMGLPLNSSGDEHGLVVTTHGEKALFSTRRKGTRGLDLCTYDLPPLLRPQAVTVVKGDIGWPVPEGNYTVTIEYVQSKRVEQVIVSEDDGTFAQLIQLEEGEDVVLTYEDDQGGYNSVVVHDAQAGSPSSVEVDFDPESLDARGNLFVLNDVQFATKQTTLSPRAKIMLKALANRLEREPEATLNIDGHTDNIGESADNLALSVGRAQTVMAFLTSCGTSADRLSVEGHGENRPKTTNETPQGRRVNRRTEFRWKDIP